jgi:hypothetical protein
MKKLALLIALSSFSSLAFGQAGELWFSYGESILQNSGLGSNLLFNESSSDIKLGDGYRFGFRFGFNSGDHLGYEIQYAFNHMDLKFDSAAAAAIGSPAPVSLGMHMHQGGANVLYYMFTTDKTRIRPFVTGGVQFDNFVPPGGQSYNGSTKFGANFGAGVKFHIKGIWAARLDAREYVTPKPSFGFALNSGALWQTEISAGVGIGF